MKTLVLGGWPADVLRTGPSKAVELAAFDLYKRILGQQSLTGEWRPPGPLGLSIAGALAGPSPFSLRYPGVPWGPSPGVPWGPFPGVSWCPFPGVFSQGCCWEGETERVSACRKGGKHIIDRVG